MVGATDLQAQVAFQEIEEIQAGDLAEVIGHARAEEPHRQGVFADDVQDEYPGREARMRPIEKTRKGRDKTVTGQRPPVRDKIVLG